MIWRFIMQKNQEDAGLNQLKTSYQAHFLFAWLIVLPLVFGFGWWAKTLDSPANLSNLKIYVIDKGLTIDSEAKPSDAVFPARTSVPHGWKQHSEHNGFLGFVGERVKIINDRKSVPQPQPPDVHEILVGLDEEYTGDLSFSPIEGDSIGVYIPVYYTFESDEDNGMDAPQLEKSVFQLATIKYQVRPEIPRIAKKYGVRGYVEILLHISKEGKPTSFTNRPYNGEEMSSCDYYLDIVRKNGWKEKLQFYVDDDTAANTTLWLLVSECPRGYHLAEELIKLLPQWEFNPATLNGEPVESFMFIKYWYGQ